MCIDAFCDQFGFSKQERSCLLWNQLGFVDKEIAEMLGLAESTIRNYLNRGVAKSGCKCRHELRGRLFVFACEAWQNAGAGVVSRPR